MPVEAIRVENLSKRFRISSIPNRTVKDAAITFLKRRLKFEDFWALKEVSFTVRQGESVGIIGRNGSGKSTLFKLISRVLEPTSGKVDVVGRISPMIELTAGFHHELTGVENIFLNCAIYGMDKKEARRKLPHIVDFAGLGDFIYSPIRMYSSGMLARLGFAIAVNVDADILLIDEIFAVGDLEFQEKCFRKISELKKRGATIIYISHDMKSVEELCARVIWLDGGRIMADGRPEETIQSFGDAGYKLFSISGLSPEKVFLALALFFGVFWTFIVPPFQAPDEVAHIRRAAALSEGLFYPVVRGGVRGNETPAFVYELAQRLGSDAIRFSPMKQDISAVISSAGIKDSGLRFTPYKELWAPYPPSLFIPQIFAYSFSRMAGLPAILCIWLMRLFNMFLWTALVYFSSLNSRRSRNGGWLYWRSCQWVSSRPPQRP